MKRNLLLISNSTNAGEEYLQWPQPYIQDFIKETGVKTALFIPYAGVNLSDKGIEASYDVYEKRVQEVFKKFGVDLKSVHKEDNPKEAAKNTEMIIVGGGNTFHLVKMLHETGLMKTIKRQIKKGVPYMGWSAGSNVACPTLCTTNDMPIAEPKSFKGLKVIPFQINPHYLDAHPEGHGGETREQRINEFLVVNPKIYVAGLREACLFRIKNNEIKMLGNRTLRVFKHGKTPQELNYSDDMSFLLKKPSKKVKS